MKYNSSLLLVVSRYKKKPWSRFITILKWVIVAFIVFTAIIAIVFGDPAAKAFGIGLLTSAISGAIMSVLIGGIISVVKGNNFFKGAIDNAISGFLDGFIAGTLILTEHGHKVIEDIEVGDKVWSYDEETGDKQLKEVVQLIPNKTDSWLHVYINEEEITCTKEHPFYILNTDNDTELVNFEGRINSEYKGQWVAAKNLKAGMKTLLSNNKNGTISSVEIEELDTPEDTYNFEVRDYHTYYVGNEGILVHNDCPYAYLDEALSQNGATRADIPELVKNSGGQFKHTWNAENGIKYQVRIHAGNPQYHSTDYIFRVSRQLYSGSGWQYLSTNGNWFHTSVLTQIFKDGTINGAYNAFAAVSTHIGI